MLCVYKKHTNCVIQIKHVYIKHIISVLQGISDVGRPNCPSPPPGTLTEDDMGIAKREAQQRQNSRCSTTGSLDGEFIPEEDDVLPNK